MFIFAMAAVALSWCLSSAPRAADNWAIELWRAQDYAAEREDPAEKHSFGAVRIAQTSVRPPYDGTHLAVLRANGSLAFDPYNGFAAAPAQMLRGALQDAAEASGAFERVVASNSSAKCDLSLEATVTRLALDCRKEGRRDASLGLTLILLKGRDVVATAEAESKVATGDGDYSAAFSRAFAKAALAAIEKLPPKND